MTNIASRQRENDGEKGDGVAGNTNDPPMRELTGTPASIISMQNGQTPLAPSAQSQPTSQTSTPVASTTTATTVHHQEPDFLKGEMRPGPTSYSNSLAVQKDPERRGLKESSSRRSDHRDHRRSDEVDNRGHREKDHPSDRSSYKEKKERDRQRDSEEQEDRAYTERRESSKTRGTVRLSKSRPEAGDLKSKSTDADMIIDNAPADLEDDSDYKEARKLDAGALESRKSQPVIDQVEERAAQQLVTKEQTDSDMAYAVHVQELERRAHADAAAAAKHQVEDDARRHEESESDIEYTDSDEPRPPAPRDAGASSLSRWMFGGAQPPPNERDPYKEIKRLNKELQNADKELRHWQRAYNRDMGQYQQHFVPAYHNMELQLSSARRHIEVLQEELRGTRTELGGVKQQLSDAVNLSEVRGKELKGAQVFLTKADAVSVNDVVGKVATLNEEVFQAAAVLGELLVNVSYPDDVDRIEARQRAIEEGNHDATFLLGEALVSQLASESVKPPKDRSNPLLVQIVMQSALTSWCDKICQMWRPGHTAGETTMKDLYEDIRKTEDQAVAGRWRSLARAHLRYSTAEWTENIMRGTRGVMAVAGWEAPASSSPDSPNDDLKQFEKLLASIFKAVQDVRKATGEDVTSADLEVCLIEPNTTFNPVYMEDAYGDDRRGKGRLAKDIAAPPTERVVSTSGLGLRKVVFKKKDGALQPVWEILAQPKVVLEKSIMEAIEPPPPTKGRRKRGGDGSVSGVLIGMLPGLS